MQYILYIFSSTFIRVRNSVPVEVYSFFPVLDATRGRSLWGPYLMGFFGIPMYKIIYLYELLIHMLNNTVSCSYIKCMCMMFFIR